MTDAKLDDLLGLLAAPGAVGVTIDSHTLTALLAAAREANRLRAAITEHHAQKADDRCWLDDEALYKVAGLPLLDVRVGNKMAMLSNCIRFIDRRCEGGVWPTYRELETERDRLRARLAALETALQPFVEAKWVPLLGLSGVCYGDHQQLIEALKGSVQ